MVRIKKPIWVVKTDLKNSRHHGLRTNTAPHCLTAQPGPGDQIVAVIEGVWEFTDGKLTVAQYEAWGELRSHAGRSASLGEDGLEDAYGNDALALLAPEILNGEGWQYAPCEWVPDGDEEGDPVNPWVYLFARSDTGWTLSARQRGYLHAGAAR